MTALRREPESFTPRSRYATHDIGYGQRMTRIAPRIRRRRAASASISWR